MCNYCGHTVCTCGHNHHYTYNWYNVENYPCNPCSTVEVCKKKIPAKCTIYRGPALTAIGLGTEVDVQTVIAAIVNTMNVGGENDNSMRINIQNALNDINARLNAIEGSVHANYSI